MQNQAVELNSVIYNAANQSFEALATLYAGTSSRSFACANNAPIDIILKDDAKDLSTQPVTIASSPSGLRLPHKDPLPTSVSDTCSAANGEPGFFCLDNTSLEWT